MMFFLAVQIGLPLLLLFLGYKVYVNSYLTKNRKKNHHKLEELVSDFTECARCVIRLMNRKPLPYAVVGMDCEMISGTSDKGTPVPATLQLATPDGFCAIFQLKVMQDSDENIARSSLYKKLRQSSSMPLVHILEDPTILKVGVGVLNDAMYLEKSYGLLCKGCIDLRFMAELLGIPPKGLGDLGKIVLGQGKTKLNKKKPWESKLLFDKQIEYAAQDAYLGVDIFMELNDRMITKSYSWLRRIFWNEKAYWRHAVRAWEKYIGKQFELQKDYKEPICDRWVADLPPWRRFFSDIAYLKYRRASPESAFDEEPCCVVCGRYENQTVVTRRKAIVPVDYNILCDNQPCHYFRLCLTCLDRNHVEDRKLREELTEECGAPYPDYADERLVEAKKIAKELLASNKQKDPLLLEYRLCEMLGIERKKLNWITLETIITMDCWPGSAHGDFVHQYFERFSTNGVEELRKRWYNRFLDTMNPNCGPIWRSHSWNRNGWR